MGGAIVPVLAAFAVRDHRLNQGKTHIRKRCKSVTFAHIEST
jgi:hypothetical protein